MIHKTKNYDAHIDDDLKLVRRVWMSGSGGGNLGEAKYVKIGDFFVFFLDDSVLVTKEDLIKCPNL